ncbi:Hypothetical protein NTJ_05677 [Nesidiocoris tenuis]|nr:Hypothetical protein NTJ_05677 [Nesidiocoris tenuis]
MYPIVLEGISVLANRLTNDQDEEDPIEDSAINGLMNTINEALKFDDMPAEDQSNPAQTRHGKGGNAFKGIEKLIESGFLKNAVSLVGQVLKDDDFQNITSHLMNKSDVKILFNKVSDVLQTTVSGLENAVKHQDLFLAMAKSTNGSSSPIDLANIVSQYVSKNGTAIGGDLSDNPLLQSAIVAKALAKSPVARLGALDESVKKLVTSSMEGAMSRIRIGENGQIQMSSGMRKMLEKMVEEHEKSSNGTTDGSSDSIMNMIQLVVKSGSIKEINPVDTGPVKRRNVTRHSPLHQKFQQKYGKSGGYATSVQSGLHHTLVGMLLLIVLPMVR